MDYSFGTWIKRRRRALDLTQQELARRVGCSPAMIVKIEADERRPSRQIAELLSNHLEIPADQRDVFLKVARQEKVVDALDTLPPLQTPGPDAVPNRAKAALPASPTPFIGREHELNTITRQLRDTECRLLTLTGPGGVGKTRLALEAASRLQEEFVDGACLISLAGIANPDYLVSTTADALGITFAGSLDPQTQIFNILRGKNILLVFDNLEHLLGESGDEESVTEFLSGLIQNVPDVKVISTSREQLKLQAEWVFEIQGLPLPRKSQISEMESNSAAKLFIQRAQQSRVGFVLADEEGADVMRICQLVEGLPLAIELAASWVRTLSCHEIAEEIEKGLGILSFSARDFPERHRSIKSVFEYSWKLLTEEERVVHMKLSAFRGGFTREAAEQVAGASLPLLSSLVAKSLIRRSGMERYDLHELIRQFAFEQLAQQPEVRQEAQERHARYFMTFLSQQDIRLRSAEQHIALAELTTEIDNLRYAHEWALAHKEFALIETTLRAYSTFFDTLGWVKEAFEYLGRVKDALESQPSLSTRTEQVALAHVLTARSLFAYRAAQNEQGQVMLKRSLEILHSLDEPRILVEALTFLGILTLTAGNLAGALELFQEGLRVATNNDDSWYAALCQTEVASIKLFTGEVSDAYEQFQIAVNAWRTTGDLRLTAFGLNYLSLAAIALGKYDEARTALKESLTINSAVGDRWGLGISHRGLGLVAQAQNQHEQALESLRESLQIFTDYGSHWDVARVLSEMGQSMLALGNDSEAEHHWQKSLQLAMDTNGILTTMDALVGFAGLLAKRGDRQRALQFLLLSMNHPATISEIKVRAGKLADEVKLQLSPEEIESAQNFVQVNTVDSVVKEILAGAN